MSSGISIGSLALKLITISFPFSFPLYSVVFLILFNLLAEITSSLSTFETTIAIFNLPSFSKNLATPDLML